jgi:hypothetical protein
MPALAADGTISIAYRGSGGYYIGDSVIFDGINTLGNTTLIKITGPGLPAEGVPLYNLNGIPGSGNTVVVDSRNQWVYSWDMKRIDTSKLQTARYTFTAWDKDNPEITATTSFVLKKPDIYMTANPSTARIGDYIQVDGVVEKGIDYIKIDVVDATGTPLRTFLAPVSGMGFFHYGFHVDMKPGEYSIKGSNPSMKTDLVTGITITAPGTTGQPTPEPTQPAVSASPAGTMSTPDTTSVPLNTRAGIAPLTIVLTLCAFVSLFAISRRNR